MRNKLQGNIAIIGMGITGFSVIRFLSKYPVKCTIFDENNNSKYKREIETLFPEVKIVTGDFDWEYINNASYVIMSPGISPNKGLWRSVPREKLISDVELFAHFATAPIIAVTGTNGKSTVCAMLEAALTKMQYNVALGGNFGTPALQLLDYNDIDFYILELSSFQLELTYNLKPRVATILNITEDHIDWHGSFSDYQKAKERIYLNSENIIVNRQYKNLYAKVPAIFASFGSDQPHAKNEFGINDKAIFYGDNELINIEALTLPGSINTLNYLATFAILSALGLSSQEYIPACLSFTGLMHRCQFFGSFSKRFWYNDSKATNSGALLAAVESLAHENRQTILLAGGVYKENKVPDLPVDSNIKAIILFGKDANVLYSKWSNSLDCHIVDNLNAAIDLAFDLSGVGDNILLSPACASFDQFENYMARGEAFTSYVKQKFKA